MIIEKDMILNKILYSKHCLKNNINYKIKTANSILKMYSIRELLFSGCPELKYFMKFNDLNLFFLFLEYIYNNKNFNAIWKLPIFFIKFLEFNKIKINTKLNIELIALATSQWTYIDKTLNKYIFIFSKNCKKNIIYSKKIISIYKEREIYLLEFNCNIKLINDIYYQTFHKFPNNIKLHEFNEIPI